MGRNDGGDSGEGDNGLGVWCPLMLFGVLSEDRMAVREERSFIPVTSFELRTTLVLGRLCRVEVSWLIHVRLA